MRRCLTKQLLIAFLCLTACVQDTLQELPSLAEEALVNVMVTDPIVINTPNSFIIVEGQGSKGIIVFNTGIPNVPYRAFDLGCPYISPNDCSARMSVDSGGVMSCEDCAEDEITFTHFNTSVRIGEDTYYLVEYSAVFNGTGIRVTNFNR